MKALAILMEAVIGVTLLMGIGQGSAKLLENLKMETFTKFIEFRSLNFESYTKNLTGSNYDFEYYKKNKTVQ